MMNLELARIAAAVILTAVAAYEDSKTSYVSDWVLYAMIGAGLLLNALSLNLSFFHSALPAAAVIALFGYVFWKRGSFGQGDVWLFIGLQLLLPEYPSFSLYPLPNFPFVLSVFLAASLFSVVGSSLFYAFKLRQAKAFASERKSLLFLAIASAAVISVPLLILPQVNALAKIAFVLIGTAAFFFAAFYRAIKEKVLVQWVPLSQVEDEDVIAVERIPSSISSKHSIGRVATAGVMRKLKQLSQSGKMRRFPIYKNLIRFNPYVLLGLLACLYAGDVLVFILTR